jgi:hypothetical protein
MEILYINMNFIMLYVRELNMFAKPRSKHVWQSSFAAAVAYNAWIFRAVIWDSSKLEKC